MEPSVSSTRELSLEEAVSVAIILQKSWQFVAAREVYRRVLEMAPDHPRALHYAGLLAHQQGRNEEAVRYLDLAHRSWRRADIQSFLAELASLRTGELATQNTKISQKM